MAHARIALAAPSLLVVTLLVPDARAQDPSTGAFSGFTSEERAGLLAGELVRRRLPRGDGRARFYGGASFQRVRAPLDVVWAKARDAGALTDLIPSLTAAWVVEDRGSVRVLHMRHAFGIGETAYYLRMELDDATRSLEFEVDRSRPSDVRAGRGFLRLTPFRGGTMVTWGMLLDPGRGLLIDLFGPSLDGWLLRPPSCLRDAVEPGRGPSC